MEKSNPQRRPTGAAIWLLALCVVAITACGGNGGGNTPPPPPPPPPPSTVNEWAWESGSNTANATGIYGSLGVPSATNVPGARSSPVSWIDGVGNLWLFGGGDTAGLLNDLWQFNPTAKTWTWISGSDTVNAKGVYGSEGEAATGNVPGARFGAVSWVDSTGYFWLFGGDGYDSTGTMGWLNDLWEFNPTTNAWTWIAGSSTTNAEGVSGTPGVPDANNVPGARAFAVGWPDKSGNLWLFGGVGNGSPATAGPTGNCPGGSLNDLWKYNLSEKAWTWVEGSVCFNPNWGPLGEPSATYIPGGLSDAVGWTDGAGNFWLFGGFGSDADGNSGFLNALWEFNPTNQEWTWVSGNNLNGALGVYGSPGVAAVGNVPPAREDAVGWTG